MPRGIQTHEVVRVAGHGMPGPPDAAGAKGDLLVQVVVETPHEADAGAGSAVPQLAELEGTQVPGPRKGIFGKLKDLVTGENPPKEEKK